MANGYIVTIVRVCIVAYVYLIVQLLLLTDIHHMTAQCSNHVFKSAYKRLLNIISIISDFKKAHLLLFPPSLDDFIKLLQRC